MHMDILNSVRIMSSRKLFVIPIYLFDKDQEDEIIPVEKKEAKQTPFYTIYISTYWVDPGVNSATGTKDIVFTVDGMEYRTPYSEQILIEVIRPAMFCRAALDEPQFITGPN